MIRYYCGNPRCGKSVICELILMHHCNRVLYIGTLPAIKTYEETIQIHKDRRPDDWDLYECSGDPIFDLNKISTLMTDYDGMLLDGLSFYISRASMYYDLSASHLNAFRKFMLEAHEIPLELMIVDQPVATALKPLRNICRITHEEIYSLADEIYYVDGGVALLSSPDRLSELD